MDFREYLTLPNGSPLYEIAPRAALDPAHESRNAMALAGESPTCILIPGRRFDATGTRHGQGGGWYDRFLAQVPGSWVRIGFCFNTQFSEVPLSRANWDQVMDYVVVVDKDVGTYATIPTHARPGMLSV